MASQTDRGLQPVIAVMGLGVSGRAAMRYLASQGFQMMVSDAGKYQDLQAADLAFMTEHGVAYECGGHTLALLRLADQVLVSPGISQALAMLHDLRARGIAVPGELAMAAPPLDPPTVPTTGTHG